MRPARAAPNQAAEAPIVPIPAQGQTPQPLSAWAAIAPPTVWWWWVLAGASALLLGLGLLQVIQLFARPLGLLILGIAIAASLAPLVIGLSRWLPRPLAVVLIYLLLLLLIILIGWLTLPPFIDQIQAFFAYLPEEAEQALTWLAQRAALNDAPFAETLLSWVTGIGSRLLALPLTIASSLFDLLVVLFVSLYGLMVAPHLRAFILSLLPSNRRGQVAQVLSDTTGAMGGYVRGVIIGGLIIGLCTYFGLRLLGVDYPLLLAVFAGLLELVPFLGPALAGVVIVGVALLESYELAIFALIFVLVLQQVESNIVMPTVMSSQTEVSPLFSLLAIAAGGVVGGVLGILVAIPLAAALNVLVKEVIAPMVRRWTGATAAPPPVAEVQVGANDWGSQ